MIIVEQLDERRTYTYSDQNMRIRQNETGNLYDTAIDYVPHTYTETDIPIDEGEVEPEELLNILTGEEL